MKFKNLKLLILKILHDFFIVPILLGIQFLFLSSACLSTSPYSNSEETVNESKPKRTIVLILIDGLGYTLFNQYFNELSATRSYFQIEGSQFPIAHSLFPSLTFPNLVSLLTVSPIASHSVMGNQMLLRYGDHTSNRLLDFENQGDQIWLNENKENTMVFTLLSQQNKTSASFAQSLYAGATIAETGTLAMAKNYLKGDFLSIDQHNIEALKNLLINKHFNEWPDFIFLHLIGADALAHQKGLNNLYLKKYIKSLDDELKPLYNILESSSQNGAKIATLLTADHGFTDIQQRANLNAWLPPFKDQLTVVNQGRIASLYFDPELNSKSIQMLMDRLTLRPEVDLTLIRQNDFLRIYSKRTLWELQYFETVTCLPYLFMVRWEDRMICPQDLNEIPNFKSFPPFAAENLISFMGAKQHPDVLLIATSNTSFDERYEAHHGGITQQEVLIPLLLKGVRVKNQRIPSISEILRIIYQ